ncbi:PREDICTED: uncharacterized protein LOC101362701 [Odobenus rosmarus divergens]|uniref:Uncharacterized protein LOC101362701 n=1 Tax=Odobenus rosmarus divergens TaxID=9708 RepID=A0A9B0H9L7_ODORO
MCALPTRPRTLAYKQELRGPPIPSSQPGESAHGATPTRAFLRGGFHSLGLQGCLGHDRVDEKREGQPAPENHLFARGKELEKRGERNMEFQNRPQVRLELVPLTVVTELPPEPRGSLPLCRTVVIRKFLC